ncbi:cilia- and flagella-associated protein 58-like [Palaemon carinicauda]|uniref:cilia- and flagella-associated protein 58-like n=1 Tax=Palaemon carinicauda TaxID=392227 RepID=UPI0035B5BF82
MCSSHVPSRENQTLTDCVELEQKEREWLEGELRAQYEAAESAEQETANLQTLLSHLETTVEDKTKLLDLQKDERENINRQLDEGREEVIRLRKEAEARARTLARLEAANKEATTTAKLRDEDAVRLQKENSAAHRQYEQLEKTVRRQDEMRLEVESQIKNLRGQLKVAEKQALTENRQQQKISRQMEKLKRERDVLHRTYIKTLGTVQKHAGLVHIRELERQNADRELERSRRELAKQDGLITALQHTRDRQLEETARVENKVMELAAEVEARGREVQRSLHTQSITRAHLQQTTTLAEALKTDNFIIGRQLRNVKTEKEEAVEECRKANYFVTKLQQNLNVRDAKIQSLAGGRSLILNYKFAGIQYIMQFLYYETNEECSFKTHISSSSQERSGRATVATQLARRNDEVRALRERVRLLEHILHKGDKDYTNRKTDIRTLTSEVSALRDEREVLSRHVKLVESLKVELVRMQRELISSQNKRAVLEEEVIRREKAHRWTTLKASDPSKYDLLRKNQLLQKRLVAATQRAAANEAEVAHKDREVEELRRMVERSGAQPDSGASKAHFIQQLRAKDDQIKSVTGALNASLLAQEEGEQERRLLKEQLTSTRRRLNLSTIAHPLYNLLNKGVEWNWIKDCQESFERIKQRITSSTCLVHYRLDLPVKSVCDASNIGLGAVLSHVMPDGTEKPIAFASRMGNADALSTFPVDKAPKEYDDSILLVSVYDVPITAKDIAHNTKKDPILRKVLENLMTVGGNIAKRHVDQLLPLNKNPVDQVNLRDGTFSEVVKSNINQDVLTSDVYSEYIHVRVQDEVRLLLYRINRGKPPERLDL